MQMIIGIRNTYTENNSSPNFPNSIHQRPSTKNHLNTLAPQAPDNNYHSYASIPIFYFLEGGSAYVGALSHQLHA